MTDGNCFPPFTELVNVEEKMNEDLVLIWAPNVNVSETRCPAFISYAAENKCNYTGNLENFYLNWLLLKK